MKMNFTFLSHAVLVSAAFVSVMTAGSHLVEGNLSAAVHCSVDGVSFLGFCYYSLKAIELSEALLKLRGEANEK